jgi:hypothetical protein
MHLTEEPKKTEDNSIDKAKEQESPPNNDGNPNNPDPSPQNTSNVEESNFTTTKYLKFAANPFARTNLIVTRA